MKNLIKNQITSSGIVFGDENTFKILNVKEKARNKQVKIKPFTNQPTRAELLTNDNEYDSNTDYYRAMPLTIKMHGTGHVVILIPAGLAISAVLFHYSDGTSQSKTYDPTRMTTITSKDLYANQWVDITITWDINNAYIQSLTFYYKFDVDGDVYDFYMPTTINCTCEHEVYGNLKSLYSNINTHIYYALFSQIDELLSYQEETGENSISYIVSLGSITDIYTITDTFTYSNYLVDAYNLVLPPINNVTVSLEYHDLSQYYSLFGYCMGLKRGPKIIEHTINNLNSNSYWAMFKGCNNLEYAPIFILTMSNRDIKCFFNNIRAMFSYCTKLKYVYMYLYNTQDLHINQPTYQYVFNQVSSSNFPTIYMNNPWKNSTGNYTYSDSSAKQQLSRGFFNSTSYSDKIQIKDLIDVKPVIYVDDIGKYEPNNIDGYTLEECLDDFNMDDLSHYSKNEPVDAYVYLGHCWYKDEMFHGWKTLYNCDLRIILTRICDFTRMSLEDDINNRYIPVEYTFYDDENPSYDKTDFGRHQDPDTNRFILWVWNNVLPMNTQSGKPRIWVSETLTGITKDNYADVCDCYEYVEQQAQIITYQRVNDRTTERYNDYLYFDESYMMQYVNFVQIYPSPIFRTYIDDNNRASYTVYNGSTYVDIYIIATNKLFREFAVIDFGD